MWDIVQRVGRPNIGLCLDTFQTGGGEWGDPTTKSGKIKTMKRRGARPQVQEESGIVDGNGAAREDLLTGQ